MSQVTNEQIFAAVGQLGVKIEQIDSRLDKIDGRLDKIDGRLDGHDRCFQDLSEQIQALAQHMDARFRITNEELAATEGRLGYLIRKSDVRVDGVIEKLREKNIFSEADVRSLRTLSAVV